MTEKDGSTLTPEARDDTLFGLRHAFDSLTALRNALLSDDPARRADWADVVTVARQQVADARSTVSEVAFVPICGLYELARIPALLQAADSYFDACAMDIVDEETGENHRDNGFARLEEAMELVTSHLPLHGMLDHEESAPSDTRLPRIEDIEGRSSPLVGSLVELAHEEEARRIEKEQARRREEARCKDAALSIMRAHVERELPEGWLDELEAAGVRLSFGSRDPAQSWEQIVLGLGNPSRLTFPVQADLMPPPGPVSNRDFPHERRYGVRVTVNPPIGKDRVGVDFVPRNDPPGDWALASGWLCDKHGHPRDEGADTASLAVMLYRALHLNGEV